MHLPKYHPIPKKGAAAPCSGALFAHSPPVHKMTKSSLGKPARPAHSALVGFATPVGPDTSAKEAFDDKDGCHALVDLAVIVGHAAPASAAPCKDAKGKFVTGPT
ncbi:hypothetical protein EWH12_17110 [Sphingobium cupriresistens]|uniref:Uncharacterized protein n=1 Tax=Sphingobium cupriresistens TaxID=1132417 RepID=A0A8G1ZJJ0_9SPHN|nr:hypothetical protein EWH12_17110 [Sphingobium cupriresistens]